MTIKPKEDKIMAQPNEALLRETYEAVGQGDLQVLLDALADDVRWADSSLGPLAGEYRGKEAVGVFFAMMFEVYAGTLQLDVLDVVANEDHAVVLTREHGKIGGEPVSWRGTHIWTFRDGECAEFVAINDRSYNRFWVRRNASTPIASGWSA
jgi:ketosteroid isomerase-like protein